MRRFDYGLYDADNHYYEPPDCFTRHLPRDRLDAGVRLVGEGDGARVMVGDRPFTFLAEPFRETAVKPGALREMLRSMKAGGPVVEQSHVEAVQPAYIDRDARLQRMDEQGVEAALLLPTFGVCVEHFMVDDPQVCHDNLHAFNAWLDEDWGFAHRDRIFAVPLLSLADVDRAVEELEWVLDRGARVVHLRPGPQGGKAPGHPDFDPFWARVDEARVPVAFHISESGYNEMFSSRWGEDPNPTSHQQSALQWTCFYGDRPIMDTIASLVFHNLFGRFPNVSVVSIENGSLWVPYLMAAMDKMKGMGRNGPWPGGYVPGRPSDVLRQRVFVSPYHEEDVGALADLVGPSQVLFGSDYPHPGGPADPPDFAEGLRGLDEADVRSVMRENLRGLLAPA